MMEMDRFIAALMEAAKAAGIETAEVYCAESDDFSAMAVDGSIARYEVSASRGLSLRGTVGGRMGYASTEAFDEDAIAMLVEGVKESAALNEAEDQDEIYAGDGEYPELETPENDLDQAGAEEKLALCLAMEGAAKAVDPRIWKCQGSMVATSSGKVRLVNSYGLDLRRDSPHGGVVTAGLHLIARDGDSTATDGWFEACRRVGSLNAAEIGQKAAEEALSRLHASPVATGVYRVILRWDAMQALLATFAGIFSAENAQQKLSLLAGREGEKIAADCVTLMDDPLMPDSFFSRTFDAEGSATRTKAVIDGGVLTTLLHSRKTARKQGTQTTGNAARSGFSGPVRVAPSNLFLKPGTRTLETLLSDMDDGLLITDLSGLHAGANAVSGDFSLLAKGYLISGGQRSRPVERVTIAGNFYQLLKDIRAVASDLEFRGRPIGSPSVDAGVMNVSGE